MARNRKRAKERRARRPQPVASRAHDEAADRGGVPSPLEHAAPDAERAERAELPPNFDDPQMLEEIDLGDAEVEEDHAFEEDEEDLESTGESGGRGGARVGASYDGEDGGGGPPGGGALAVPGAPVPEPRARPGNRLVGFLQGSWRELQRVQWPDRRQVMQATGVVIGFVIVAGLFLGASDFLAGKLVNLILYGHT